MSRFAAWGHLKGYGVLQLTVSSPQLLPEEPLTLDEGKELAKIEHDEEDGMIASFITASRVAAEKETAMELAVKQYDLTMDYFSVRDIELSTPLQSVDLFQIKDSSGNVTTMVEGVNYIVDLARGVLCPPWGQIWPLFTPWPSGAILIRFRSGYPCTHPFWSSEGAVIMTGMKFLITDWWSKRDISIDGRMAELPYRAKYLFGLIAKMRAR